MSSLAVRSKAPWTHDCSCITTQGRSRCSLRPVPTCARLPFRRPVTARALPDTDHSSRVAQPTPLSEPPIDDGEESSNEEPVHYESLSVLQIVFARTGWLALFCAGLVGTAFVIESFEDIIEKHVELSFFVPLVMGHGGNTGSQTVSSLIRALALRQVHWRDVTHVVGTEAAAGGLIGLILGLGVLALASVWSRISGDVGMVVALSMPVVSLWSNGIAALITLTAHHSRLDPTMTSGPMMATVVDTTGLFLYLQIARAFIKDMDIDGEMAVASNEQAQVVADGLLGAAHQVTGLIGHIGHQL